ncbi:putative adhesion G protein-coupled receptor E4P isoform X2 [Alosa sapidissima]|uniref:putative adhesion G protein-coupled receptor E4P isoform X2 n=1 Tax=Alosa sapidissima TaxID=34773 RepID=UPI001C08A000|nr:putative adhesion G protein-coupled receptor E4P isoform X2 [Alosa sapidissima]
MAVRDVQNRAKTSTNSITSSRKRRAHSGHSTESEICVTYVDDCSEHPCLCLERRLVFCTNNTEGAIFTIRPQVTDSKIPWNNVAGLSVDISLPDLFWNTTDWASVELVLHRNMKNILESNLLHAEYDSVKTLLSDILSLTLPKSAEPQLSNQLVKLTVHYHKSPPLDVQLSCILWKNRKWHVEDCDVTDTNSTHSVCTCTSVCASTFALIMQTAGPLKRSRSLLFFDTIIMSLGLLFLAMSIVTFALCQRTIWVNTARLNLCVCLFVAQLLFLLTQNYLHLIHPNKVLCCVLSGLLQFLFLCAFTWMHLEAVTLFLLVRKLKELRAHRVYGPNWAYLHLIGYGAPLVVVGVAAGVMSEGYGSEECWLKADRGFMWSFVGPVIYILMCNTLLFLGIFISLTCTLAEASNDLYKIKEARVLLLKSLYQFTALGCPWILGIFASRSEVLETLFLFLTSQQGTFIFLIHCVLNQGVQQQLRTWRRKLRLSCQQAVSRRETYAMFTISNHRTQWIRKMVPCWEFRTWKSNARTVLP